jgi:8-oxo-dGTP pyrophosphatase MutT (NUDIX family)
MARPAVAAGALFVDDAGAVLLVRPTYKPHWDIPGGYVEPGESPRQACVREVREELGISPPIGRLLVIDWAPAGGGDRLLFVFDGGHLSPPMIDAIRLQPSELDAYAYYDLDGLPSVTIPRLVRRLAGAVAALRSGETRYLEHGEIPAGLVPD